MTTHQTTHLMLLPFFFVISLLNSSAQTSVTRFITNKLFGKGRQWNGKSFDTSNRTGMNRFEIFAQEGDPYVEEKVTVILKTELDHSFDLELADSRLHPGQPSIVVTYKPYQGPLSLWKSMVDELRILPCNSATHDILIGMGSMGWSGGVLNCSPFCLYRRKQKR